MLENGKIAIFAEFCARLLTFVGNTRTRKWENKEGVSRQTTEILCSAIVPLEWKKEKKTPTLDNK